MDIEVELKKMRMIFAKGYFLRILPLRFLKTTVFVFIFIFSNESNSVFYSVFGVLVCFLIYFFYEKKWWIKIQLPYYDKLEEIKKMREVVSGKNIYYFPGGMGGNMAVLPPLASFIVMTSVFVFNYIRFL